MTELTIYDSEGNEYPPKEGSNSPNRSIKDLLLSKIQLAVHPSSNTIIGYFNAKKTGKSRNDQFYAKYIYPSHSDPLAEFSRTLNQEAAEIFFSIDTDSERMSVFDFLNDQDRSKFPGDRLEKKVLRDLAAKNGVTTIGVSSPKDALGILKEYADQFSIAIADTMNADPPREFDIAVVVNSRYQNITPINNTADIWDREIRKAREKIKRDHINDINNAVEKLKYDFDMNNQQVLNEINSLSVPKKEIPMRSGDDQSISAKIKNKKYMLIFILLVVLVLIGILLYFGVGPIPEYNIMNLF